MSSGMSAIQDALVSKMEAVSGINAAYLRVPESMPTTEAPVAFVQVKFMGTSRETCGPDGLVMMSYRGLVTLLLGGEDMLEQDAAEAAGDLPDLVREALYTDETLGGVVWQCVPAPQLSGDNIDTYQVVEGQAAYPVIYFGLDITDWVNANAAANA